MRIKGTVTQVKETMVDVRPQEALDSLRAAVFEKLEIRRGAYLNDKGHLCLDEDYYTSHSYSSTEVLTTTPSPDQVKAVTLFNELRSLIYTIKL